MAPFSELSRSAQLRRLGVIARCALRAYLSDAVTITPLSYGENATYRVKRPQDGARFLLRVHTPRRPSVQIRSELIWLEALQTDGFTVASAVCEPGGDPIVTVASPGVPEPRHCTLMTWVEGRIPRNIRTARLLRGIGAYIARLHEHSAHFCIPHGFTRPRWDVDSLVKDPAWREGWQRLTPSELNLFQQTANRFAAAASQLAAEDGVFGVIHGDFTFDNVLFYRGSVRVIDFDDCGFGYFLYDIATLLDRLEWRDDYHTLRAALIEGYRTERELRAEHEAMLDIFLLTRWAFLGLAFLSAPERSLGRMYAARFMKIVIPKMQKYLLTI